MPSGLTHIMRVTERVPDMLARPRTGIKEHGIESHIGVILVSLLAQHAALLGWGHTWPLLYWSDVLSQHCVSLRLLCLVAVCTGACR
jgi:hypothetical protein